MKGKKGRRKNKGFRVKQQYWNYKKVISRIIQVAQENRVYCVYVNPAWTSCKCPSCGHIAAGNRIDEVFL